MVLGSFLIDLDFRILSKVCSLLLSHGADPTLVNCHNKSALDLSPTTDLREKLLYEYRYFPAGINDCQDSRASVVMKTLFCTSV